MKFDILGFHQSSVGPKARDLLSEIAPVTQAKELAQTLPPQPSFELSSRLTLVARGKQHLEIESATDAWIQEVLSQRSCHAFDSLTGAMVVARSGMYGELLGRLRKRHAHGLCSDYRAIGSITGDFRVVCFGDYGAEGHVCWEFAGKHDGAVLVYCEFHDYSGDWWRPHTAEAETLRCALETTSFSPVVRVLYRVTSARVLANLWSRTSHDDGIACECFPAATPLDSIWAFDRLGARVGTDYAEFARRHGWVYTQMYGGGSDEHYAVFAARDPALASSVYAYAAQRSMDDERWWIAGRR